MYSKFRLLVLSVLYELPLTKKWAYARMPKHKSGYAEYWLNEQGSRYRSDTLHADQDKSDMRHFPSPGEFLRILRAHHPSSVLEVGCGYGRLLEHASTEFRAQGCDLSAYLLRQVRPDLQSSVFELDIINPPVGWVATHAGNWDIVYCWCVMMYFIDNPDQTKAAMIHLETLAKDKVIIWEWKHICEYMQSVYPSAKFEYHHIPLVAA
jgi:SAM-dependent methyltransferase